MTQPIANLDAATATFEQNMVGRVPSDVLLLAARILFGFPLLMNGIGQIAMPGLMETQMTLAGVSLAWKWPAIFASLLGGFAILVGWRVRLAAALLIVYVVIATALFHNTHMQVDSADPLAVPASARNICVWFLEDFKGVENPGDELVLGCAMYRLFFDMAKFMDHITMMVPALLLLWAAGPGRFSLEKRPGRARESRS